MTRSRHRVRLEDGQLPRVGPVLQWRDDDGRQHVRHVTQSGHARRAGGAFARAAHMSAYGSNARGNASLSDTCPAPARRNRCRFFPTEVEFKGPVRRHKEMKGLGDDFDGSVARGAGNARMDFGRIGAALQNPPADDPQDREGRGAATTQDARLHRGGACSRRRRVPRRRREARIEDDAKKEFLNPVNEATKRHCGILRQIARARATGDPRKPDAGSETGRVRLYYTTTRWGAERVPRTTGSASRRQRSPSAAGDGGGSVRGRGDGPQSSTCPLAPSVSRRDRRTGSPIDRSGKPSTTAPCAEPSNCGASSGLMVASAITF